MSNKNKGKKKSSQYPFVSVCTPTFNRRPFIKTMLQCFRNQDYPKSRIEWIIIDDGTDKVVDLITEANIPQIQYISVENKMSLGAKRNFMHSKTKGSIIVYMDDDDYYPPQRISHAVERLQERKDALCAGASEIYVYFKHINKMYQAGPYGPNHATAGTFAFRRELLDQTNYEDRAALAEEKHFLKNYTIPFVQLDPLKTILVFSHTQNTFDKKKLLENPSTLFVESSKTVDMFIRNSDEEEIKNYFMRDIDNALKNYKAGDPILKPDVLVQMKEIEVKRDKMIEEAKKNGMGVQVMMRGADGTERQLNHSEIVQLLKQQQEDNKLKNDRINQLQQTIENLRYELSQHENNSLRTLPKEEEEEEEEEKEVTSSIINIKANSILVPEIEC
jgi:glycosyltransferase involved in cell wall biosynthesis